MPPQPLPSRIGNYRIDSILGEGAMGVVYRGYDAAGDRPVAVKTMRKDLLSGEYGGELLQRFRREAESGMHLSHQHVVAVYDYGEDETLAFMTMAFIEGRTLKELNATRAPWPLLEALNLADQLLEALDFFHERGVVHRDIKPANIMVDAAGMLTVTDFGVARTQSSNLTQVGTILGTPAYMSPEQITGQPVDGRSDLFAVGVVLYEMLTGTKPFRGEMMTIANNIVTQPHPDPSTLQSGLPPIADQLFRRALAKRREDRYGSGSEFRAALQEMRAAIVAKGNAASPESPPARNMLPPGANSMPAAQPVAAPPQMTPKEAPPGKSSGAGWALLAIAVVTIIGIVALARMLLR